MTRWLPASAGRSQRVLVLVATLAIPALASAQFGHPLDGQWSGEWGPKEKPVRLLLDLDWDGKEITGRINPGQPTEAKIAKVTIDYADLGSWVVKMEAAGNISVNARLENIGAYRRVLRGTWTQGGKRAPFTVTRN
jgi:hypothetical protein